MTYDLIPTKVGTHNSDSIVKYESISGINYDRNVPNPMVGFLNSTVDPSETYGNGLLSSLLPGKINNMSYGILDKNPSLLYGANNSDRLATSSELKDLKPLKGVSLSKLIEAAMPAKPLKKLELP